MGLVGAVSRQPGRLREELADRRRREVGREVRDVLPDGIVEPEQAALAESMTATAVKVFECDATRNRCRTVSGASVVRSATPKARSRTISPRATTATEQPGCRDRRI